jgi:hypothetical protein
MWVNFQPAARNLLQRGQPHQAIRSNPEPSLFRDIHGGMF